MTYEEAMEYIKNTNKLGSVPGLEAIRNLLERLGNPQDKLKIIHVAGTNGKGSTISFLSAILAATGYRVGIYISPTVFSYREKLQIVSLDEHINKSNYKNNIDLDNSLYDKDILDKGVLRYEYISEEDVAKAIRIIKSVCDDIVMEQGQAHPTSFEIETAMAFLYMQWEKVDLLIVETGMGGRLDATNIISQPICSIITSISMDHMEYLGDNLSKIAMEKAGIMKPNTPVITCSQEPEVMTVLNSRAKELGIPILIADASKAHMISYASEYTEFSYPTGNALKDYRINMLGKYQLTNAIIALETAIKMNSMGYIVKEKAMKMGLKLASIHGRFERISSSPDMYIDGAHNKDAALRLRDSIEIYFTNRRLIFMIGVLADKDYTSMLRILAPLADVIITLTPDNPRALSSDKLANEARAYCFKVFDENDIEFAIKRAYTEAKTEDVIFAFGSLSFLGSLVSHLKVRKDENND